MTLIEFAAKKLGVNETVLTDKCNKYERLNDKTFYTNMRNSQQTWKEISHIRKNFSYGNNYLPS